MVEIDFLKAEKKMVFRLYVYFHFLLRHATLDYHFEF